jgi:Tol biopolymer transport system component
MRRIVLWLLAGAVLFALVLNASAHVSAQAPEPTTIIDAILNDLSQKLGTTIRRTSNVAWTWEQINFPDTSLGCPQPSQSYAQTVTPGFRVIVTFNNTAYDYRAKSDGSQIFQCGGAAAVPTPTQEASTPTTTAPGTAAPTPLPPGTPAPTVPGSGIGQSVTYQKPLAYVGADGNVFLTALGQGVGTPITSDSTATTSEFSPFFNTSRTYGQFRWSPDGQKLIFTELTTNSLFVAVSGQKPVRIATGLATLYPGTWSPDGTEVAYAVDARQAQDSGEVRQIQAVQVAGATIGQPRVAGSFVEGTGCGGGSVDPAQLLYVREAGYQSNGLTLDWTAQGFVYSTACTGIGLALANPNGQVLWTAANVGRVAVSPDRTRAVGIQKNAQNSQLVVVDLASGSVTPVQAEANPDQVGWSSDGAEIVYSTVTPGQVIKGVASPVWQQIVRSDTPLDAQTYAVNLWRVAATGGPSTRLFQQQGFAIGVIAPASDSSGVAFSFIPSDADLVQQVNGGASAIQARSLAPRPQIYFVNWNGDSQSGLIAPALRFSGQPAFSSGEFTAISAGATSAPGNVSNPNLPPPDLVIGGQAVVSTTGGDTLNLRRDPSRSAPVLRVLKQGTTVTILAGPQSAEGFRWWQVRANDDNSVGWVVDQVTDQSGTVNTLTPQ